MYINDKYKDLKKVAGENSSAYLEAKPFPNIVFDNFEIENCKTKEFLNLISKANKNVDSKTLIVLSNANDPIQLAVRNIPTVETVLATSLNIKALLRAQQIFLDETTLNLIKEIYCNG